ncbi:MAG: hypothetical protein ACI86H_001129 [bacterium]|jgi:hypothetical protein
MRKPSSVKKLEELGRVQLSSSFFMRDFLYSEISQIEMIPNIPDDPDLAIEAGKQLCLTILEPIQEKFGRISIRSGYRSPAVNQKGNEKNYNCASNEANYGGHIWDYRDANHYLGATACIVVNSFLPYYEKTGHWQAMAWWIHDNIPAYSELCFFPILSAFNVTWNEKPKKIISSHVPESKGNLTKPEKDNFAGDHSKEYLDMIRMIENGNSNSPH